MAETRLSPFRSNVHAIAPHASLRVHFADAALELSLTAPPLKSEIGAKGRLKTLNLFSELKLAPVKAARQHACEEKLSKNCRFLFEKSFRRDSFSSSDECPSRMRGKRVSSAHRFRTALSFLPGIFPAFGNASMRTSAHALQVPWRQSISRLRLSVCCTSRSGYELG
jgi:hypothetical protein